ncbi:MAG: hypothetical protein USCGTAYLOR_01821 [Chromatiales bacterium USCg_Taylor]|nr:MAG: hypothetical protein USCGTAYLOR_01821 [Chromatiales bacterium USCg_Taylor]
MDVLSHIPRAAAKTAWRMRQGLYSREDLGGIEVNRSSVGQNQRLAVITYGRLGLAHPVQADREIEHVIGIPGFGAKGLKVGFLGFGPASLPRIQIAEAEM